MICQRCGEKSNIHRHHIIMKADGGNDEPDNIMPLCVSCHMEWHALEIKSTISFEEWLTTPTYNELLAFYRTDWPSDMDAKTIKDTFIQSVQIIRAFKSYGED